MKILFSIVVLSLAIATAANAGEISYFNRSWEEIKAKAKTEHKYIFVDCYTEWCGWCKTMDKETMTDSGIIATMNDKFVAVKMDMEKGEGIKLAMKYHVRGFPTFVFFNPDGEYVYEVEGYKKTAGFLEELSNATNKNKQFPAPGFSSSIDMDYPAFYKDIFGINGKRMAPAESAVTTYLDQQKDLFTETNWAVVSQCQLNEKYNRFFLDNIGLYRKRYGGYSVNDKLNSILNGLLQKAADNKSTAEFATVMKMVDTFVSEEKGLTTIYFEIYFYKATRDWNKCTVAANKYISQKGYDDLIYINGLAWAMYESCTDQKLLKKAATWMKEVVNRDPKYMYLDTYASLLYKSGQLKDAKTWADRAIETGKKSGFNTAATEELLKKIAAAN